MKRKYNIGCSKCGTYAVTYNMRTCVSIRTGKRCGGKIYKYPKSVKEPKIYTQSDLEMAILNAIKNK